MSARYFHGGHAGLNIGDAIIPAPAAHVDDDCLICQAKRVGRTVTVGEYRAWLATFGARAVPALRKLDGAPDDLPIDPPRAKRDAIYVTTDPQYALWYAARSRGDLYRVAPVGPVERSVEDHFPSFTCAEARVVEVLRRGVRLTRRERREIERAWKKADARAARAA